MSCSPFSFLPIPWSVELTSGGSPLTREWVLVGVPDGSQVGSPERLAELENMKQRITEHGMITVI